MCGLVSEIVDLGVSDVATGVYLDQIRQAVLIDSKRGCRRNLVIVGRLPASFPSTLLAAKSAC